MIIYTLIETIRNIQFLSYNCVNVTLTFSASKQNEYPDRASFFHYIYHPIKMQLGRLFNQHIQAISTT